MLLTRHSPSLAAVGRGANRKYFSVTIFSAICMVLPNPARGGLPAGGDACASPGPRAMFGFAQSSHRLAHVSPG